MSSIGINIKSILIPTLLSSTLSDATRNWSSITSSSDGSILAGCVNGGSGIVIISIPII